MGPPPPQDERGALGGGGHGGSLTKVERLGPCQHPVPCSYFMALKRSFSGPAQEPQVLEGEKDGGGLKNEGGA